MSQLLTTNPVALRYLMSETIFNLQGEDQLTIKSDIESEKPARLEDRMEAQSKDEVDKTVSKAVVSEEADLKRWGDHKKGILFLIRNTEHEYFSIEAKDAFLKTLSALNLTLEDIAVINLAQVEIEVKEILNRFKVSCCIFSEIESQTNTSYYNNWNERQGLKFLYTHDFEEMLTDSAKKRVFWNAIKEIKIA